LVYIICTTCLKRLLFNFYLSWVVSSIQVWLYMQLVMKLLHYKTYLYTWCAMQ
jgi:hypothetical protein